MSDGSRWLATRDGTVTVMFTDIAESSRLLLHVGEACWLRVLREHNRTVREQVRAHGGAEVKFLGDGFMVVFAHPTEAVQCAIAIQRTVRDVALRVGIHTGSAVKEGADFLGPAVIVAARLTEEAPPGGVVVSSVVRLAAGAEGVRFGGGRLQRLRGLGDVRVFEAWDAAGTPRAVAH
jgi:class 3 adenylate cyclase